MSWAGSYVTSSVPGKMNLVLEIVTVTCDEKSEFLAYLKLCIEPILQVKNNNDTKSESNPGNQSGGANPKLAGFLNLKPIRVTVY